MLGNYDRLLELRKSLHHSAKEASWGSVYAMLKSNPGLGHHPDPWPQTLGWSLTDHAVYQERIEVILMLRQQFQLRQSPQPSVILSLALSQRWPWILCLLNERILSVNVICMRPNGERVTLLDLAASNVHMVKTLCYGYAAKTAQELDVKSTIEKMFIAAKQKRWSDVFKMISEEIVNVDFLDRSTTNNATLLHYAYEQRNQTAFLKLIDECHASLDEIRNEDNDLYGSLLDFYDQCNYDRDRREEERLIEQFKQTLSLSDETQQTEDHLAPVSRPLIPSPLLTSSFPVMSDAEIVGIRALKPENDEIIEQKVEKRVPWKI